MNATLPARLDAASFWLLVAALGWSPFPLGSARQWSAALLILLIAAAWILFVAGQWPTFEKPMRAFRRLWPVLVPAALALLWGLVQTLGLVPSSFAHPLWAIASQVLHAPLTATVSLDPWRTNFEVLKLLAYGVAFFLALAHAENPARAGKLADAVIFIVAGYGIYALALWYLNIRQFEIFYDTVPVGSLMAGPFVLHNSYATFAGLGSAVALSRLFALGTARLRTGRGFRPWALSLIQFLFGSGAPYGVAFLLCFSTLVFSASRAGFAATLVGFAVMAFFSLRLVTSGATRWAAFLSAIALVAVITLVFETSGTTLAERLNQLAQEGGVDNVRELAWASALRMIADSPWLGLGLGTFEKAYPLYGVKVIPFILDKAHNDWLEFAAGLGLPAAIAWWISLLSLSGLCVRGIFRRRRHRAFALAAIGATVLVAFHSAFDFSLQIPAVALLYAVILGTGVAQSWSTRERRPAKRKPAPDLEAIARVVVR